MRKVFSAGSYIEAQLLRGYLEQAGISVTIINENSSGTPGTPHWALPVAAEIWVQNDEQQQAAIHVVRQYFSEQSADNEAEWLCGACNESNPGCFEICWNCGHAVG